jgi:hypothetical protein
MKKSPLKLLIRMMVSTSSSIKLKKNATLRLTFYLRTTKAKWFPSEVAPIRLPSAPSHPLTPTTSLDLLWVNIFKVDLRKSTPSLLKLPKELTLKTRTSKMLRI